MKKVTLTFDNGPTPGVTDRVLAILAERNIKATFFVVGQQLQSARAQELLSEIAAQGHWVGNHTFTHSVALGECPDPAFVEREIGDTQRLLEARVQMQRLFRPTGKGGAVGPHLLSESAVDYLAAHRYTCVIWNNVPRDWEGPAWVERCLSTIDQQDWSVIVLHDIDIVDAALPRLEEFLDELRFRDVQIVQDFPDDVVLLRNGAPLALRDSHVAGRA